MIILEKANELFYYQKLIKVCNAMTNTNLYNSDSYISQIHNKMTDTSVKFRLIFPKVLNILLNK